MSTWRITWGEYKWDESDVTGAHLAAIVTAQGIDTWEQVNPFAGPGKLMTMIAVLLAGEEGRPLNDTLVEVGRAPALQILNSLDRIEVEPAVE